MRLHLRRQVLPEGSRERQISELVEDEVEAELRKEAERLDALASPPLAATDRTHGGDLSN